jgi:hypothetical protein
MLKRSVFFIVLAVVATVGSASYGSPPTAIGGGIATGRFSLPSPNLCHYDFLHVAGRMPAGSKMVNVTGGTAVVEHSCIDYAGPPSPTPLRVTIDGETPQGSYEWTCLGSIDLFGNTTGFLPHRLECSTAGLDDAFVLTLSVNQYDAGKGTQAIGIFVAYPASVPV